MEEIFNTLVTDEMDIKMVRAMLSLAARKTLSTTVYYSNSRRAKTLNNLIVNGYLIPKTVSKSSSFDASKSEVWSIVRKKIVLTDKGKDWFMSLNPDDFVDVWMYPTPSVIRNVQSRIRN